MVAELQALAARAQVGDRTAFGELYEELAPKIYSYLYHHTNSNRELAEDLAEDVFVKVLEKLDTYEDRGLPFGAWVYRVARNHLIDHVRRNSRQAELVQFDEYFEPIDGAAEQQLERGLTHQWLVPALQQLTEGQRQVIVLRFLQGMSVAETAHVLDRPEDGVKKLQARALHTLRRALGAATFAELAA